MATKTGRLWEMVLAPGTLENAWGGVLAKYPRMERPADVAEFARDAPKRIASARQQLARGTYAPAPAALVEIPKPNKPGQTRPISVLRAEDRIVLSALHRVLEPVLERQFSEGSHAFRRGRGVGSCARAVELSLRAGFRQVAGADIHRYFENIPRAALLDSVRGVIWEQPVLELLEVYLAMGAVTRRRGLPEWVQEDRGIAQGSPLSPLLANVYLIPFDRYLDAGAGGDSAALRWVRYADNFLLFGREREGARTANENAIVFLRRELELEVNTDSRVLTSDRDGFLLLGFLFQEGRRKLSPARIQEMGERLRSAVRGLGASGQQGFADLTETIEGWRRYYESALDAEVWQHLDAVLTSELRRWVGRLRDGGKREAPAELRGEALEGVLRRLQTPVARDETGQREWVAQLLAPRRGEERGGGTGAVATGARTKKAVAQRRRQLEQVRLERTELLVNQPGTYLGRKGERISIRRDGKELEQIPLRAIQHITILDSGVSLSGELMADAAAMGISIHLIAGRGRPEIRIGPIEAPQYHLSLLQFELNQTSAGLDLARRVLMAKVGNQENLLRYFLKYRTRANQEFLEAGDTAVAQIAEIQQKLKAKCWVKGGVLQGEERRGELNRMLAMEGQAAGAYWKAFGVLLRGSAPFAGRERRGARDLVNSLLNYGYAILYSRMMQELAKAGLNPNLGFLHAPRPNKPALLFDMVEEFRPAAVDRIVCGLLGRSVGLHLGEDGTGLDAESRRILARAVVDNLQSEQRYRSGRATLQGIMSEQVRELIRHLKGESPYRGYVMPW